MSRKNIFIILKSWCNSILVLVNSIFNFFINKIYQANKFRFSSKKKSWRSFLNIVCFFPITGRNRKKSESKITPPTVNLPPTSTVSSVANRPPPGPPTFTSTPSTTPLSAPLAPPQPQATSKLESSENRKRGPGRPPGSTKQNIEQQRMQQQLQQQQVSFTSVSYFWENLGNRSEQAIACNDLTSFFSIPQPQVSFISVPYFWENLGNCSE